MDERSLFSRWLDYDDSLRKARNGFAEQMLSRLPEDVAPVGIGREAHEDKGRGLAAYDEYASMPEAERSSPRGRELAGIIKAYVRPREAQSEEWRYPQERNTEEVPFSLTPTRTKLSSEDEARFQAFYAKWAKVAGINPDPDAPGHKYDYRGAFAAGHAPQIDDTDGLYHWPSKFKDDDHPNRFVNGIDTKYERKLSAEGRRLGFLKSLVVPFATGMAEFGGSLLKGVDPFVPGDGPIQSFMTMAGEWLQNVPTAQMQADSEYMQSRPMWIADPEKPWTQELKDLPDVINGWAARASANAGLMIIGMAGGAAGAAVFGQLGPQAATPEEAATVPVSAVIGAFVSRWMGSTIAMTGVEAANFLEMSEREYGLDRDIAEKYSRLYGVLSGAVEGLQQLSYLRQLKGGEAEIAKRILAQQKKVGMLKKLALAMGDATMEGGEEVTQGFLMSKFIKQAIAEQRERNPDWHPTKEAEDYTLSEAKTDFTLGTVLGGIYKLTGSTANMIRGNVDPQTQQKSFAAQRVIQGSGIVRTDDLRRLGKQVGEVVMDPDQAKTRIGGKVRRGSIFDRNTNRNARVMEDMLAEYKKMLSDPDIDADLEIGRWLANRFGMIEAESANDFESLEEARKRGELKKAKFGVGVNKTHYTWLMSPDFSRGEDGVRLANAYGLAMEIEDPKEFASRASVLSEEDLHNDDYMSMIFARRKNRDPEEIKLQSEMLRAAKQEGFVDDIAIAPLVIGWFSKKQLSEAGYGTSLDHAKSRTLEDGTVQYLVTPLANVRINEQGKRILNVSSMAGVGNITEDVIEAMTRNDMLTQLIASGSPKQQEAAAKMIGIRGKWLSQAKSYLQRIANSNADIPSIEELKKRKRETHTKDAPKILSRLRGRLIDRMNAVAEMHARYQRGNEANSEIVENTLQALNGAKEILADDISWEQAELVLRKLYDAEGKLGSKSPVAAAERLLSLSDVELLSKTLSYHLDKNKKADSAEFSLLKESKVLNEALLDLAGERLSTLLTYGNVEAVSPDVLGFEFQLDEEVGEGAEAVQGRSEAPEDVSEEAEVEGEGAPVDELPPLTEEDEAVVEELEKAFGVEKSVNEILGDSYSIEVIQSDTAPEGIDQDAWDRMSPEGRAKAIGRPPTKKQMIDKALIDKKEAVLRRQIEEIGNKLGRSYLRILDVIDTLHDEQGISMGDIQKTLEKEYRAGEGGVMGVIENEIPADLGEFLEQVDIAALVKLYEEDPFKARERLFDSSILLENTLKAKALGITDPALAAFWDARKLNTKLAILEASGSLIKDIKSENRREIAEDFIDRINEFIRDPHEKTRDEFDAALGRFAKVLDYEALVSSKPRLKLKNDVELGLTDIEIQEAFEGMPGTLRKDLYISLVNKAIENEYDSVSLLASSTKAFDEGIRLAGTIDELAEVDENNDLSEEIENQIKESTSMFDDHARMERRSNYLEDRLDRQKEDGFEFPSPQTVPLKESLKLVAVLDIGSLNGMNTILSGSNGILNDVPVQVAAAPNFFDQGKPQIKISYGSSYTLSSGRKARQNERWFTITRRAAAKMKEMRIQASKKIGPGQPPMDFNYTGEGSPQQQWTDLYIQHQEELNAALGRKTPIDREPFEKTKANPNASIRAAVDIVDAVIVFYNSNQLGGIENKYAMAVGQFTRTGRVPPVKGLTGMRVNDWDLSQHNATRATETYRSVLPLDTAKLSSEQMAAAIRSFVYENSAQRIALVGGVPKTGSPREQKIRATLNAALNEAGQMDPDYKETISTEAQLEQAEGMVAFQNWLVAKVGRGSNALLINIVKQLESNNARYEAENLHTVDGIANYLWSLPKKNRWAKLKYYLTKVNFEKIADQLEDGGEFKKHHDPTPQDSMILKAAAERRKEMGLRQHASETGEYNHDLIKELDTEEFVRESLTRVRWTTGIRTKNGVEIAGKYIRAEDIIFVDKELIRKKYNERAWIHPKFKGVDALPANAFKSLDEWEAFVVMHEIGHRMLRKAGINITGAAAENIVNGIALDRIANARAINQRLASEQEAKAMAQAFQENEIQSYFDSFNESPFEALNPEDFNDLTLPYSPVEYEVFQGPGIEVEDSFSMEAVSSIVEDLATLPAPEGRHALRDELLDAVRKKRARYDGVLRDLDDFKKWVRSNGIDERLGMVMATVVREDIPPEKWDALGIDKSDQIKMQRILDSNPAFVTDLGRKAHVMLDELFADFNRLSSEMTDEEFIRFYRENYVPHLYIPKKVDRNKSRSLEARSANQRVFNTFVEAEQAGYVPLSLEIDKLIARYAEMNYSLIANRTVLEAAPMIMSPDGDPMVITRYATDPDARVPIADKVEQSLAEFIADRLGVVSKSLPDLIRRFNSNRGDYVKMRSPYKGVQEYWVHPDAVNTMKWVLNQGPQGRLSKVMNVILRVNNWAKFSALGLSFFHHFALTESYIAANGGKAAAETFLLDPVRVWFRKTPWQKFLDKTKTDAEFSDLAREFLESGLQVNTSPTYDISQIEQDLDHVLAWAKAHNVRSAKVAAKMIRAYKGFVDKHLWNSMLPGMKLYTAHRLLEQYEGIAQEKGMALDRKHVMEQISAYVNYAYGGIEFERYMGMTPNVRKVLTLAVFAPDWTISNMNIADVLNIGGGKSPIMLNEMQKHYWPWMAFVITAIPAAVQALIYGAVGALGGDRDEDDQAFMFKNETGQQLAIDVTPILRLISPTAEGTLADVDLGIAKEKRYYITFGKQAREVGSLVGNPLHTFYSKTSIFARIAMEQITGTSGDFDMPWRGKPFWSSLPLRAEEVGKKFVPMSVASVVFDDRPSTLFAPGRFGMSRFKAKEAMTEIFEAYANPTFWNRLTKGGETKYVEKLDSLVVNVAEALRANVGDQGDQVAEAIISQAAGNVKKKYYEEFFDALNKEDYKKLDEAAQSIIRLGGAVDGFNSSMNFKFEKREGVEYTYEKKMVVEEAVHAAEEKMGRPRSISTDERKMIRELKKASGGSSHVERYLRNQRYGSANRGAASQRRDSVRY